MSDMLQLVVELHNTQPPRNAPLGPSDLITTVVRLATPIDSVNPAGVLGACPDPLIRVNPSIADKLRLLEGGLWTNIASYDRHRSL